MPGISQEIQLVDKVSPTLNKIQQQAMQNVKQWEALDKKLRELDKTEEKLVSMGLNHTKLYKDLEKATADIVTQMNALEDGTNRVAAASENVATTTTEAATATQGASAAAGAAGAAMVALNATLELVQKGWNLVKQATQEAYQMMDIYNQKFNAQFTGGLKMHNILGASADEIKSMFSYAEDMQKSSVFSSGAFSAAWGELSKSAGTVENVKKLTPIMVDMAVAEKGVYATTTDLTSAASQLQRALNGQGRMLRYNYGLTEAQIKKLESLNDVTEKTDYLVQIMSQRTGNANELLLQTAQGGLMQARNELTSLKEELGEKLLPYIAEFERAFYTLIEPAITWLIDNLDELLPVFIGVAAILGIIVATIAIMNFGPLILFVGILGMVVYAILQWQKKQDELTGQVHSSLGMIMSFLATFVAFVYDLVIVPIWNAIASIVNFLANAFNDPVASIQLLFLDLATTIMSIAREIAGVIDILFGTNSQSQIDSWISALDQTKKEIKSASTWEEVVPMLENWDTQQAARQGYEFGDNMAKNISKAIDDNDFFSKFDEALVPGADGTTALNTTTGDNLLGEEEIQLLLDIATRDVRFDMQQITPEVTITFTGDINAPADIDNVSEAIVAQMEEALDGDLEVAYAW